MVQREVWQKFIIDFLFKDNSFINNSYKVSGDDILNGKVVHIPQAGAPSGVVVNPSSFPLAIQQRVDTDIVYLLNLYATLPTHITDAEKKEVSYDKMASVLGANLEKLEEFIAESLLVQWLESSSYTGSSNIPAAQVIRTTGDAAAAHLVGATGNRKKFTKEELKKAKFILNKQGITKQGRFALLSSDMLDQLMDDEDLKKRDSSMELDMKNGVITRLYGFDILERASTAVYTNAATPIVKQAGASASATDNDVAICWQKDAVEYARGTVDFYEDLKNPQYLGDIYNASIRMGGRKRRQDGKGIVSIVQDSAA